MDDTTIIFTSDHGEMLGDHNLAAKQVFFEGSAHIPMIVVPAKGLLDDTLRGTRCDSLVCLADVLPTCLEAAGVEAPRGLKADGISLFDQLRGKRRRKSFFARCGHLHCVIEGRYKYLWTGMGGGELLFDLENDPYEQCDLAKADPDSDTLERMRALLVSQMRKTKAEGIKNGRLAPYLKPSSIRESRVNSWPGFHSSKQVCDVMH
jgi:arylsulfatase A-like enzyme